jgi:hypothetical protein
VEQLSKDFDNRSCTKPLAGSLVKTPLNAQRSTCPHPRDLAQTLYSARVVLLDAACVPRGRLERQQSRHA